MSDDFVLPFEAGDPVPEGYWEGLMMALRSAPLLPEYEPIDEPEPLL